MKLISAITTTLILLLSNFAFAAEEFSDANLQKALVGLEGSEKEVADTAEVLTAWPREKVLASLKKELLASIVKPPTRLLKAAVIVKGVELAPELKQIAEKGDRWVTYSSINQIFETPELGVKNGFVEVYKKGLPNMPPETQMAMVDGLSKWKITLDSKTFNDMTASPSYELRESTIRNLFATMNDLPAVERDERLSRALSLKPYQIRLFAMKELSEMNDEDLKKYLSVLPRSLCASERQAPVLKTCKLLIAKAYPKKSSVRARKGRSK